MTRGFFRPPIDEVWAYKSGDETVNNSTAYQDDNHLVFTAPASSVWAVEYVLFPICATSAAADMKVQLTMPAGATAIGGVIGARAADGVATSATIPDAVVGVTGTMQPAVLHAIVTVAATAGAVTLQWAQNTLTVADTVLKAGSYLRATRLS